jgi:hypothetical protein
MMPVVDGTSGADLSGHKEAAMATQQHSSLESSSDRCSHIPLEAAPRGHGSKKIHLGWALPGLLGLALGMTGVRIAGHGDQGPRGAVLGSNTEPTALVKPSPGPKAPVQVGIEQEEEDLLPMALPFDDYVARKAIELRTRGVRCGHRGKVEVRVLFAPSGMSVRAEVGTPGMAPKATRCILNHVEKTLIPSFRGGEERAVQVSLAMR